MKAHTPQTAGERCVERQKAKYRSRFDSGLGSQSMPKHPQHKAREIRVIGGGDFVAWSIYPDQLPAMEEAIRMAIGVEIVDGPGLKPGDKPYRRLAVAALRAIGIQKRKGTRSKR